jgi:Restriction endonuclease/TIR domain
MSGDVRVFVGHHHSPEEDAFTVRLVADLEAAGADVWVDTRGLTSGNFIRKISEGLAGRQWLVLIMTPAALGSEWVQEEVDAALYQVKVKGMLGVIPFIPPIWAPLHRYDATGSYELARDGLLEAIGLPVQDPIGAMPALVPHASGIESMVELAGRQVERLSLTTLDGLLLLTPREFEDAVALMLTAHGYRDVRLGSAMDEADIICRTPAGSAILVECRRYQPSHKIGAPAILHLVGLVSRRVLAAGLLVTTAGFTSAALEMAARYSAQQSNNITLVDGSKLVQMMQRLASS